MCKQHSFARKSLASFSLAIAMSCIPSLVTSAAGQYHARNLVANERLLLVEHQIPPAHQFDPNIANAWGLAFFPASPIWVSDELTGKATLYTGDGSIVPLVVTIPRPASDPLPPGQPTGMVANSTAFSNTPGFKISQGGKSGPAFFIFDTLDGTISGWNPTVNATNAVIAVDNSGVGAAYTGLTIATNGSGDTVLYAADAGLNFIEMYDSKFKLVKTFGDPAIPRPFGVYGIQALNGHIYVTYAPILPGKPGAGFVDVFDLDGTLVKQLISSTPGGPLNIPWGLAMAPSNFGMFSNALLVGNLQDGLINAFDPATGNFLGALTKPNGKPIQIPGLWSLAFGGGGAKNGPTNALFYTAGPDTYFGGVLGVITAVE